MIGSRSAWWISLAAGLMLVCCGGVDVDVPYESDGLMEAATPTWALDPTATPEEAPTPEAEDDPTAPFAGVDLDGDGYTVRAGDCDDLHADSHPGAPERCGDHRDNDCDRFIDEPDALGARTFHADQDGDGFGDTGLYLTLCEALPGFVDDASDCDDHDPAVHPDAAERCGDEEDTNCDGDPDIGAEDSQRCQPLGGGEAIDACQCPEGYAPVAE